MRTLLRLASYSILFTMVLGSYGIAGSEEPTPPPGMKVLKLELPKPDYTDARLFGQQQRLKNLRSRTQSYLDKYEPFYVPEASKNLSLNKLVTSSDQSPLLGELSYVTDGIKRSGGLYVELDCGVQWVQIDLGTVCNLYAVAIWHYFQHERVYFDVVVQIANDPNFHKEVKTLFNNDTDATTLLGMLGKDKEYIDTENGHIIDLKGNKARYIRLYSNGNTENYGNHYSEVEVWGTEGTQATEPTQAPQNPPSTPKP